MYFATRTVSALKIIQQISEVLCINIENIAQSNAALSGVTIVKIREYNEEAIGSLKNIDAYYLHSAIARNLWHSINENNFHLVQLFSQTHPLEHYDKLIQLLHIAKADCKSVTYKSTDLILTELLQNVEA